ncbi:MAG TPA: beta-ketoacyl synthase [Flavobacteriales bacterium]|nr:beta-ketoacyl synthase [Flavobacteriales bacterium]
MEAKTRDGLSEVYVGAKSVLCPLGDTPSKVFEAMLNGESGLQAVEKPFGIDTTSHVGLIPNNLIPQEHMDSTRLENMLSVCYERSVSKLSFDTFQDKDGLVIICTTKGNIDKISGVNDPRLPLPRLSKFMQQSFDLGNEPIIISNACISGVLGIIAAARLIRAEKYDHVMVIGADIVSEFTLSGFSALHALTDGICQPYDKNRKGINLGEAASGLVLSNDETIFKGTYDKYISGASSNDANHISGPSRTGEGLHRSIERTLKPAEVLSEQIGYLSAHGTGTSFNDEMESIAFKRSGLSNVPVNSLKGYFGHTLGAAGVIEVMFGLEAMKRKQLLPSLGHEEHGVSESMNIVQEVASPNSEYFLKTASGFGGCNAAALFKVG